MMLSGLQWQALQAKQCRGAVGHMTSAPIVCCHHHSQTQQLRTLERTGSLARRCTAAAASAATAAAVAANVADDNTALWQAGFILQSAFISDIRQELLAADFSAQHTTSSCCRPSHLPLTFFCGYILPHR
jgi:hypothetical protein